MYSPCHLRRGLQKRKLILSRNGTSMISLIIPPKDQIPRVQKLLAEEYGTASNIKSRVNRLSVLGAITSTQQRLKLYNRVPPNGLVVFCGCVLYTKCLISGTSLLMKENSANSILILNRSNQSIPPFISVTTNSTQKHSMNSSKTMPDSDSSSWTATVVSLEH